MGDRRNVIITEGDGTGVALYTHWTGSDLPVVLKAALKRGESRWNDTGYLARIIFSDMIKGYETDLLGFGIYPATFTETIGSPMEDAPGYDIVIDTGTQTVDGIPFTTYIS